MSLKVALQMDPIEAIDITGDTSFAFALEAQARGHDLYYYLPDSLTFEASTLYGRLRPITVRDEAGHHVDQGPPSYQPLSDMDVILMRQDPPFDMAYITATHLLEHLPPTTMVVNHPAEVRNAPEKIMVLDFPDLMPPTMVSRDMSAIAQFRERHKDIIIKPLYGNGGAGVFLVTQKDKNFNALLEMFFQTSREPVMIQAYLPDVTKGDKRIILIDGEAVGAINRIPSDGEARSNMHVGGKAVATELSARDHEICRTIGPVLRQRGLLFVGIDVIGDYLTEINVTSPTGIREFERFTGINLAAKTFEAIEKRYADYKSNRILR
ncbi:MAG: glutathione synthase [Candidatus Puniceispirillaceae bacterium]